MTHRIAEWLVIWLCNRFDLSPVDGIRLNPNSLQEMTDAAMKRLDAAWNEAATIERAARECADA